MAAFGAKYINFAPVTKEPEKGLPLYGRRMEIGEPVKTELAVKVVTGELYADNRLKEREDEFVSGSLVVEVDDMTKETEAGIYGEAYEAREIVDRDSNHTPYGGLGYYKTLQRNEERIYEAHYYPKVKAVLGMDNAGTEGSSDFFTTKTITFMICEPASGEWRYRKEFTSEAEAISYINRKLAAARSEG
ncbi:MAG: hypothetical protein HFI68_01060 [Lachnospiraceae bacterium]|nr:hypothetical protein [Lachnospiraceae bacterium]